MKHCVYCAGIMDRNKESIKIAERVKNMLESQWMLEHDCILHSYHSEFEQINGEQNIEIYLSNDNMSQLIDDCMEFARVEQKLTEKSKI